MKIWRVQMYARAHSMPGLANKNHLRERAHKTERRSGSCHFNFLNNLLVLPFFVNVTNQHGFIFKTKIKTHFSSLGSHTAIMSNCFFSFFFPGLYSQSWQSSLYISLLFLSVLSKSTWYNLHNVFQRFINASNPILCMYLPLGSYNSNACDVFGPSVYKLCGLNTGTLILS